ncbi:MAG: hypothetical protein WAW37_08825 [Syntrophobacteraceae bacterium]
MRLPCSIARWLSAESGPLSDSLDYRSLVIAGTSLFSLLAMSLAFHQVAALRDRQTLREIFHWLLVFGLAVSYVKGYRALRALPPSGRVHTVIFAFAGAFLLVSMLTNAFHSTDVRCYVNLGWMQAHYHQNPYAVTIPQIPGWREDPVFYPEWLQIPAPYGFVFSWLAAKICQAGNGVYWATVLLFKTLNVAAVVLTAVVLWLGCRDLGVPDAESVLYLFLWSPLLLIHGVANAHNDVLMAFFTVTGLYLALRDNCFPVLPVLMLGVLVKYASAVILPFAVLYLARRHGWGRAAAGVAGAVGVLVLFSLPYVGGDFQFWRSFQGMTGVHNSIPALLFFPFEVLGGLRPSLNATISAIESAIRIPFWIGFLLFGLWMGFKRLRMPDYPLEMFLRDCLLMQFILICVVSSKYYAWYLCMIFPLCLWLPSGDRLRGVVLALSVAQIASLTFVDQAHGLNVLVMVIAPILWAMNWWPFTKIRAVSGATSLS